MKKLRVGFVGLGSICRQRHVPGLRRLDDVEIVAVANRSVESGKKAAREFGIPVVCDSWRDLVACDDVDAVFIGTWPCMHHPVTLAALYAGKHVFCQARMAMNYKEAREMYDLARKTGLVAMLCPVPIGLALDRTIARLNREGFLGEIRLVRVQSLSDVYASATTPMNWRKDHRISGLNMLTLGMYIEVMHRWFGLTKSVSAQTHIFVKERTDAHARKVPVRIPDQILINAVMAAGFPIQYAFSAVVHHGSDSVEVYGSKATLRYDVAAEVLYGTEGGREMAPIEIRPEDAYDTQNWRVERDFVEAIRHGTAYHPNFEDGMRYMQVIQAVYDSASLFKSVIID